MYVKLKNVNTVRRGGRTYYYHRKTGERLPADPDIRARRVLEINASVVEQVKAIDGGTVAALVSAYKASPEFKQKSEKTKKDYRRYLSFFEEHYADEIVANLDAEFVWELRDTYADTPRKADYLVQVLSVLCTYALRRPRHFGLTTNPCQRVSRIARSEGIHPWPSNVLKDALEAAYPELRWAILMGLYLGQRAQDDIALTWRHYDGQRVSVRQSKTGKRLSISVHPTLKTMLDTIPRRGIVMLTTRTKRPWKVDHLRHEIRALMEGIGHPGYSRHGLRKNAVNNLLEAGCTVAEVSAVTGQTMQMVEHYAQRVNQQKLADAAIRKLIRNDTR